MRLTEQKINHISVLLVKGLKKEGLADFTDETQALRIIRETTMQYLRWDEILETEAREKIKKQKKSIPEGSDEWRILYKKYYDEAKAKRKW